MPNAELPSVLPQTLPPEVFAGGGAALWIFFAFGLVITAGFAFALYYHWFRFGYMYPLVWIAMPIYGVGVLVLVGAMLSGIAAL